MIVMGEGDASIEKLRIDTVLDCEAEAMDTLLARERWRSYGQFYGEGCSY